jgi:excisionase family DNA binding protein
MVPTGPEQLLTVRDVVRLTNLAERTVRAMLADGRLEAVRPVGVRVVRIPTRAVERLLGRFRQEVS